MTRKKLLLLVNHPVEDGSARYRIYQFVPYLEAAGYECTIRPFSSLALFRAIRSRAQNFRKATLTIACAIRRLSDLRSVSSYDLVVIHREASPFFMP
jgi:hypothetical protein